MELDKGPWDGLGDPSSSQTRRLILCLSILSLKEPRLHLGRNSTAMPCDILSHRVVTM